ncbi:S49 family peptidase [Salmonella enterica]|nr:S49 family peptidase [Salmonella enterica subsp. enterica serovar Dahomey]
MQKMINLPHLANQVFGAPLYATRDLVDAVKSVLIPRIMGGVNDNIEMTMGSDKGAGFAQKQDGAAIAVIPVHGILVPRRGQITAACQELTSYEKLRDQVQMAVDDPSVMEVVLDINSSGGMVSGCKEVADFIFASREIKPITAIVNFNAFSAAYFIASACSKVVISNTSGVGSIGVIMEHLDASGWEENNGLKFTSIFRGDNKNMFTPHEPLSDSDKAAVQAMVDASYDTFVSSVAQYRGMDVQAVINTQAALYYGADAIAAGLADEMRSPQDAINAIAGKYTPAATAGKHSIKLRAAAMNQQSRM